MAIQKRMVSVVPVFVLLLSLSVMLNSSIAKSGDLAYWQKNSLESGVCSTVSPSVCGYVALLMANMVENQVPKLPEGLPSSVDLYFKLVQRQVLVDPAGHRIFYGTHYTKFGDLRVPKGSGPFPVAIVVHGGGWRSRVTLDYTVPLADALACTGIAAIPAQVTNEIIF